MCYINEGMLALHHAAHSRCAHGHFGLVLLLVADDALSGEEHAGHAGCILQSDTGYLGGVYYAGSAQVAECLVLGIVAVEAFAFAYLVYDDCTFHTCVGADLTERFLDGAADNGDTGIFISVVAVQVLQSLLCADVGHTATRYDTFLDGCAGSTEGVVAAVLLFFLLCLAGSTDFQYAYTAGELGQTFLQLLLVVGAGRVGHFVLDLLSCWPFRS